MTTVEIPKHERTVSDTLRIMFDTLVPVLLTAVIISLILFRVDVLHRFDVTAGQIRGTACQAVKESNDDLDRFLAGQAAQARNPKFDRFVADLARDHAATYSQCLTDGTLRPSK